MSRLRELKKEAQVNLPTSGETYVAEDGTASTVLDDNYDETYEPPEEEVSEYAKWLGIELPEEADTLLWIALEGLKAPLPKEWKPCKTDSGEVYYFNFKTGDSIWDHPMDEHYKSKVKNERRRIKEERAKVEKQKESLKKEAVSKERSARDLAEEQKSEPQKGGKEKSLQEASEAKRKQPEDNTLPQNSEVSAPRILSEQQKRRLEFVKDDLFRKRNTLIEETTTAHEKELGSLRETHGAALDSLKTSLASSLKATLLVEQQKGTASFDQERTSLESNHLKGKASLLDEQEIIRKKINELAEEASGGSQTEEDIIREKAKQTLEARVSELSGEISEIRDRHRRAQLQKLEIEKSRMELELRQSKETAVAEARKQTDALISSKRSQHLARCSDLQDSASKVEVGTHSEFECTPNDLPKKFDEELNSLMTSNTTQLEKSRAELQTKVTQERQMMTEELTNLMKSNSMPFPTQVNSASNISESLLTLRDRYRSLNADQLLVRKEERSVKLQESVVPGKLLVEPSDALKPMIDKLRQTEEKHSQSHADQLQAIREATATHEAKLIFEEESAELAQESTSHLDILARDFEARTKVELNALEDSSVLRFDEFVEQLSAKEHESKRQIDMETPPADTNTALTSELKRVHQDKDHELLVVRNSYKEQEDSILSETSDLEKDSPDVRDFLRMLRQRERHARLSVNWELILAKLPLNYI